MGFFGWLDRLAGKADEKVEPAAVAMGAQNAPTPVTAAAVAEIEKEEEEETEA